MEPSQLSGWSQASLVGGASQFSLHFSSQDNGSRVAVKMFASVDFRALQREIRAVETIGHHENIVKLIDVDEEVCVYVCVCVCVFTR